MIISLPSTKNNLSFIDYSNEAANQIACRYPLLVIEIICVNDAFRQSKIYPSNVKGDGKLFPARKAFVSYVVAIESAVQQIYWVTNLHAVRTPS